MFNPTLIGRRPFYIFITWLYNEPIWVSVMSVVSGFLEACTIP
jgi:hypothetical protein